MKKAELVKAVATKLDVTQKEARTILDGVSEVITDGLVEGKSVTLTGLGSFKIKNHAARDGRNPATGEPLVIPAHNRASFKVSSVLKELVK